MLEAALARRRHVPFDPRFLELELVEGLVRSSDVAAGFTLHVVATTDAASEALFIGERGGCDLIFDIVGAELAYHLHTSGCRHADETRFDAFGLIILRLATLKSLNCGDAMFTLAFLLAYLDEHVRISMALQDDPSIGEEETVADVAAKSCAAAFLIAHEASHALARRGDLISESVDKLLHTVSHMRAVMEQEPERVDLAARLAELEAVLIERPATWPNAIEELACDFRAIEEVIDAIARTVHDRDAQLAGLSALNAAVVSTWLTYAVGDAVEAYILDQPSGAAHSVELLHCRALLSCSHAASVWFGRVENDLRPSPEFIETVMASFGDVDQLSVLAFNRIFHRDAMAAATLRASALLELGVVDAHRIDDRVLGALRSDGAFESAPDGQGVGPIE